MAKTSYLDYLRPRDITEEILSRLTVKALLRFKSVSKSWNSIISDPLFVKNHHQRQSSSQDLFVRCVPISDEFTLVRLGDKKLETLEVLESPSNCKYVLCSYGGVLLLTDGDRIHVLWDPSTRTHKNISIPFQTIESIYWLCPDPTTDSFKIVVANTFNYSVYSAKTNSLIINRKWFDGLYTDYGRRICGGGTQVCVDGAVYWVLSQEKIIYYDPRDDMFKILQKPEYIIKKGRDMYLADLGGSLCLRCRGGDETKIKMWIKDKGIDNHFWKEFITVENVKMGIWSFEPQCLVGNKIVIRDRYLKHLAVYSPLDKTFEQLGDTELDDFGSLHHLIPYLDSPTITWRSF